MSDLTTYDDPLLDLTLKQARAEDAEIRRTDAVGQVRLFLFEHQKGYKALGFESFESYLNDRDIPKGTVEKWKVRITETLRHHGHSIKWLYARLHGGAFDLEILPTRTAAELHRLPSADMVTKVMEEFSVIHGSGVVSEAKSIKDLQRIVQRHLSFAAPRPEPETGNLAVSQKTFAPRKQKTVLKCEECGVKITEGKRCDNCKDFKPKVLVDVVEEPTITVEFVEEKQAEPKTDQARGYTVAEFCSIERKDGFVFVRGIMANGIVVSVAVPQGELQ